MTKSDGNEEVKITKIRMFPITLAVKPEFYIVSSAGAHAVSRYVVVAIETDGGLVGWGEATVVPVWSGETQGGALALIQDYFVSMLMGRDPVDIEAIAQEMDGIIDNPFTKAAVEMALLDLAGKQQKKPVYELLGGAKNRLEIPIKFSIGLREPDDAANIAATKVKEGFTAIKLKVGPDPERDLARVRAVREAVGTKVRMNVDVNGGWTVEQAIRETKRYEPYRLEYVEQPTPRWDIEGMARVKQAVGVPIMADESVFSVWQAEQVIAKKAADLISIYPGKNGGILKSKKICEMAGRAGIGCHLGSNLEWDIGTAAMCHLAAACANVTVAKFPVDILGPLYYAIKPRSKPVRFDRGHVFVPEGNGLGVEICAEELEALGPQALSMKQK
ncbi:MAG TPA: mandelate racemase/muconate lactonizing enzyme family protein [Tepidisphaeraceae bacterium]